MIILSQNADLTKRLRGECESLLRHCEPLDLSKNRDDAAAAADDDEIERRKERRGTTLTGEELWLPPLTQAAKYLL